MDVMLENLNVCVLNHRSVVITSVTSVILFISTKSAIMKLTYSNSNISQTKTTKLPSIWGKNII